MAKRPLVFSRDIHEAFEQEVQKQKVDKHF